MMYKYNPQTVTHPKDFLLELLDEKGLTLEEFSNLINEPTNNIQLLINEENDITEGIANKIEEVFKIPAYFWLECQKLYNECNNKI